MGYGAYSYAAHEALTKQRAQQPSQQVFTQSGIHPSMNPYGVKARESRDSADHPDSIGIAFALDVSGSMGDIPQLLATQKLPGFMKALSACKVKDPQVLFMAFTDHENDGRPLQVGQFETTAELMDQWLTRCSLAGGGVAAPTYAHNTGKAFESYDLALHFAARHISMDCFEKRGKKGYLFVTGDEPPYLKLRAEVVQHVLGTQIEDAPLEAVIAEVKQRFEVFFLVPDPQRYNTVRAPWEAVLGDRVIAMNSPSHTTAVAAGLVALGEGLVTTTSELQSLLGKNASNATHALERWIASPERKR